MANIKRCDWCAKEYDRSQFNVDNPAPFLMSINDIDEKKHLCSLECMEEVILDRLEDQKYNRKMKGK